MYIFIYIFFSLRIIYIAIIHCIHDLAWGIFWPAFVTEKLECPWPMLCSAEKAFQDWF